MSVRLFPEQWSVARLQLACRPLCGFHASMATPVGVAGVSTFPCSWLLPYTGTRTFLTLNLTSQPVARCCHGRRHRATLSPPPICVCRSAHCSAPISTHHNISIKAEPGSPPHDHRSQSGYMTQAHGSAHPHSSSSRGRSPVDSVGSSCSSHEGGSDREEQQQRQRQRQDFFSLPAGQIENPTIKRMRMDSWVT